MLAAHTHSGMPRRSREKGRVFPHRICRSRYGKRNATAEQSETCCLRFAFPESLLPGIVACFGNLGGGIRQSSQQQPCSASQRPDLDRGACTGTEGPTQNSASGQISVSEKAKKCMENEKVLRRSAALQSGEIAVAAPPLPLSLSACCRCRALPLCMCKPRSLRHLYIVYSSCI